MASVFEVPLRPSTPQKLHINLSGVDYTLWFYWDAVAQLWFMDIGDTLENPLLQGISLVTGADLLEPYRYAGIPGAFFCQGAGNPLNTPKFGDLGVASHLFWIMPASAAGASTTAVAGSSTSAAILSSGAFVLGQSFLGGPDVLA